MNQDYNKIYVNAINPSFPLIIINIQVFLIRISIC